jgi:hypothetical protein
MRIVNQRNFPADLHLKALNIRVDTNEMMQINGKLRFSNRLDFDLNI